MHFATAGCGVKCWSNNPLPHMQKRRVLHGRSRFGKTNIKVSSSPSIISDGRINAKEKLLCCPSWPDCCFKKPFLKRGKKNARMEVFYFNARRPKSSEWLTPFCLLFFQAKDCCWGNQLLKRRATYVSNSLRICFDKGVKKGFFDGNFPPRVYTHTYAIA